MLLPLGDVGQQLPISGVIALDPGNHNREVAGRYRHVGLSELCEDEDEDILRDVCR